MNFNSYARYFSISWFVEVFEAGERAFSNVVRLISVHGEQGTCRQTHGPQGKPASLQASTPSSLVMCHLFIPIGTFELKSRIFAKKKDPPLALL